MKRIGLFALCLLSMTLVSLVPYSSGSPGGKTGSISDSKTCTQCHSGTAVEVENWITTSMPEEGYTPGETYSITVEGTHSGVSRFGFELTAEDKSGNKKGAFIITDATQTKLVNNNKSVTHTSSGNTPSGNSKTWSFDWTAPEAGSGEITMYAALNAANGNFGTSGDVIYRTSLAITENTGTGIDHIQLVDRVKVYQSLDPNTLIINYPDEISEIEIIRIYDLKGSLHYTAPKVIQSENISIDISSLNSDVYIVQLQTREELIYRKTLIIK